MRILSTSWGVNCTPEDFPNVAMKDTHHYNKYDNVNIDLQHQDREWLDWWRKFTGVEEGSPDGMDDVDPWAVTGIDSEVPTPEAEHQYLGASIVLP